MEKKNRVSNETKLEENFTSDNHPKWTLICETFTLVLLWKTYFEMIENLGTISRNKRRDSCTIDEMISNTNCYVN